MIGEIQNLQSVLDEYFGDYDRPEQKRLNHNGQNHRDVSNLDDRDLLDRIFGSANGNKIKAVWDGDTMHTAVTILLRTWV